MRFLIILILIFSSVSFCHASEKLTDSTTIELALLWRLPVDPATWEIKEFETLRQDSTKFIYDIRTGYKPKNIINVFGHEVLLVMPMFMCDVPVPNVILKGSPENIINYIREKYKIKFVKKGNKFHGDIKDTAVTGGEAYRVQIKDHVDLVILPLSKKKDETWVIGEYLGGNGKIILGQ